MCRTIKHGINIALIFLVLFDVKILRTFRRSTVSLKKKYNHLSQFNNDQKFKQILVQCILNNTVSPDLLHLQWPLIIKIHLTLAMASYNYDTLNITTLAVTSYNYD